MKINAVLQKYPELERPEAVFEISNIAESVQKNGEATAKVEDKILYNTTREQPGLSVNPPFAVTCYEDVACLNPYPEISVVYDIIILKSFNDSLLAKVFFVDDLGRCEFMGTVQYFIDKQGKLTSNPVPTPSKRYMEMPTLPGKSVTDRERLAAFDLYVTPALYANALLNCKNVSTDAHDFPNRRSISHYRRTGKPYFEKYYTLKVKLPGKKHTAGNGENGGWSNAFHIYRGHFKTYTEAAPLFGKLTGTYWWESGIRGNLEAGIIDKDYELEAGE